MFIVIEGLDGVGKSTIAAALAKEIGAEVLSTPGKEFNNIRGQLDSIYQGNHQARQLFYMSTVMYVSEKVRELISIGKTVIVDRYWLSTQVYHQWKSIDYHFELEEVEKKILIPDVTLYLYLPLKKRTNRLICRENNTLEDNQTLGETADEELNTLYSKLGKKSIAGRWVTINTDENLERVIKNICYRLDNE
jgi:thymidylate kinase